MPYVLFALLAAFPCGVTRPAPGSPAWANDASEISAIVDPVIEEPIRPLCPEGVPITAAYSPRTCGPDGFPALGFTLGLLTLFRLAPTTNSFGFRYDRMVKR
jgi:hypothetical protein